jgi:hypothetical protein
MAMAAAACDLRARKALLARQLTTILPAMTLAEAIETTRFHSVAGLTGDRTAWVTTRPCRAPYHTISDVGLIGGSHVPMPGDVSLAHNGVLFLDELPEFYLHLLEVLRQPLEKRVIGMSYPAHPRPRCFGGDCRPGSTPHGVAPHTIVPPRSGSRPRLAQEATFLLTCRLSLPTLAFTGHA